MFVVFEVLENVRFKKEMEVLNQFKV